MKSFKVRGKQIGDEAVTICAPLCAQKRFDLLSETRRIVSSCAPMVEWRLDLCQEAGREETLQLTMMTREFDSYKIEKHRKAA